MEIDKKVEGHHMTWRGAYLIVCLFFACVANAAGSGRNERPIPQLWKLTCKNGAESYVLGSVHVMNLPDREAIVSKVLPFLSKTQDFFTETLIFDGARITKDPATLLPPETSLGQIVGDDVVDGLINTGIDNEEFMLERRKPWAAFFLLHTELFERSICDGRCSKTRQNELAKSLDMELQQAAGRLHLGLHSLETMSERASRIETIPANQWRALLLLTQHDLERKDLESDEKSADTINGLVAINRIVIHQSNLIWIQRLKPQVCDRPTFIVVGLSHLSGQIGVLNLLRGNTADIRQLSIN